MPLDTSTQTRKARYWADEDTDALADYEAEMARDEEGETEAADFGYTGLEREMFTSYDQHGFLDSEWSR